MNETPAKKRTSRRRSPKLKKQKKIHINVDSSVFLEFKRFIFHHDLTIHQFLGYLIQQASVNDDRVLELAKEARGYKQERIRELQNKPTGFETGSLSAQDLYQMIEEKVVQIQEGTCTIAQGHNLRPEQEDNEGEQ